MENIYIFCNKLRNSFRLSWAIAFILGLGTTPLVSKIHFSHDNNAQSESGSERPSPVSAHTITNQTISNRFLTHGFLKPAKEVVLRPNSGSTVRDVMVSVGDRVTKGQVLAHLDSDYQVLRGKLDRIDAQTRSLDYGVTMALAKKQFLSANEVKQKKLEHEASEIRMRLAELENSSTIKSPIDGIIGEVSFHSGDFIDNQSNYAIRVVDTSSQKLQLYVPQSIALKLNRGKMAKLVRKQYDDQGVASEQSADAVLDAVAPIVDAKTGSVQIDLTASQVPNNWVSGMFVQIEITTEEALNAVTVPNSAIVYENGKSFVFRVGPPVLRGPANDQVELKVEKIPVVLGIKDTIMIEVKSGLAQFDQIISEGQGHLIDGSIVEIIQ